jgi:hypothetical protein
VKYKKGGTTARIRLYEGDLEIARAISEATDLAVVDVISLVLRAGLAAIKENKNRFQMPLKFCFPDTSVVDKKQK